MEPEVSSDPSVIDPWEVPEVFQQPSSLGAGVAAVFLLMALLWTPPVPPTTAAAVPTDPYEILADCGLSEQGLVPCTRSNLAAVLEHGGFAPTFQMLQNLSEMDTAIASESHNLAHHLGRLALTHYGTSREALRQCPTTMASGCFHGVLERYFNDVGPPTKASDLRTLCTATDGKNRHFQCLHGLGHGLMMVAGHHLPQTLAWCELLNGKWEQESCAGGAFMENVVGDDSMEGSHHEGHAPSTSPSDHSQHGTAPASTAPWVRLKENDTQYPCNAVAEKWWHACYWMQSSALLQLGKSMQEVFAACNQAPPGFNATCYQSIGRDVSGSTLRDGPAIVRQCNEGLPSLRGHCIYGAAQEIVNNAGEADPGLAFCRVVPLRQKADCYGAVGAMVSTLHPADSDRIETCRKAEVRYQSVCLKAARS